jgi:hypothetical protein
VEENIRPSHSEGSGSCRSRFDRADAARENLRTFSARKFPLGGCDDEDHAAKASQALRTGESRPQAQGSCRVGISVVGRKTARRSQPQARGESSRERAARRRAAFFMRENT